MLGGCQKVNVTKVPNYLSVGVERDSIYIVPQIRAYVKLIGLILMYSVIKQKQENYARNYNMNPMIAGYVIGSVCV